MKRQQGMVLIGMLITVALMGILMMMAADGMRLASRREREQELLWIGDQFRNAIASYASQSPTGSSALPKSLDDLLRDSRFPQPVRHLRKIYIDPITGSDSWGLIRIGGGIAGVYSESDERPLKRANFPAPWERFINAPRYSDWKFQFTGLQRAGQTVVPANQLNRAGPMPGVALPGMSPTGNAFPGAGPSSGFSGFGTGSQAPTGGSSMGFGAAGPADPQNTAGFGTGSTGFSVPHFSSQGFGSPSQGPSGPGGFGASGDPASQGLPTAPLPPSQ